MVGDCTRAAAVLQGHLMDAVGVENEKTEVTWNGNLAISGVVELDFESNRLQGHTGKF